MNRAGKILKTKLIMKKVILTLAVVAFVASLASCKKVCTCTTYTPGFPTVVDENVEIDDGECSDMNTVVGEGAEKTGMECNSAITESDVLKMNAYNLFIFGNGGVVE